MSSETSAPAKGAAPVPLSGVHFDGREEELVLEVLRSGRLSLGPTIDRFEELIAKRVGAPFAAAVSSGTAGLHMLAHIRELGPGDEVITSPISFVASANCFIFEGATPVFADVDPQTLNLDPAAVEDAITERTKAIVAVDMFGYPCELDELQAICDRHGLALIEDSAEALGAEYRGRPLGSHGPSAVFGFYPNKQMTTGEGGVVVTHSEEEWQLLRSLRNQGRSYGDGSWFNHVRLGFNYRWTDIQAAIGIAQLEKLDEILELRAAAAARYTALLDGLAGVETPLPDDGDHRRSWFVYVIRLAADIDRDGVMKAMRGQGISTAEYVPCVHLQPYLRERYGFAEGTCPLAEGIAARTLALPFWTGVDAARQERVVEALSGAIAA
jgi:perosamine synthetase